jgi:hypothetical protein
MTLVKRDPFARTELHKRQVKVGPLACCDWCGTKRTRPCGSHYLYELWTEHDGGRKSQHKGRFCGVSCFRSFNS